MVNRIKQAVRSYTSTLFSTLMLGVVSIHTLEDIALMSIGRFVPLPLFAMYALGLALSWLVMGLLFNHMLGKTHRH